MYFEFKDELNNTFINLDKVDKISLRDKDNKIIFTTNGNPVIIYCNDDVEANEIYKRVTETLIKEKGVVSR